MVTIQDFSTRTDGSTRNDDLLHGLMVQHESLNESRVNYSVDNPKGNTELGTIQKPVCFVKRKKLLKANFNVIRRVEQIGHIHNRFLKANLQRNWAISHTSLELIIKLSHKIKACQNALPHDLHSNTHQTRLVALPSKNESHDLYVILLMQALVLGHCCQRSWWICFVTPGSPIWFLLTYQHFDSYPAHWQLVQWLGIQSVDVPKVSEASQGGFAGSIATQSSTLVGEPGCVTPADFNFNISEPVS